MNLNKEQINAVRAVERAFAKCISANVYFHNCYGTLRAYDGNVVKDVNDTKTETPCSEGYGLKIDLQLDSWADDLHYVHKKDSV